MEVMISVHPLPFHLLTSTPYHHHPSSTSSIFLFFQFIFFISSPLPIRSSFTSISFYIPILFFFFFSSIHRFILLPLCIHFFFFFLLFTFILQLPFLFLPLLSIDSSFFLFSFILSSFHPSSLPFFYPFFLFYPIPSHPSIHLFSSYHPFPPFSTLSSHPFRSHPFMHPLLLILRTNPFILLQCALLFHLA
ncbi:hypothetical protein GPALN_014757 [Globodera pallida]|nr:hypothetical protein GPALN_014757 [Globodera pallida]